MADIDDSLAHAEEAGLRYVDDRSPGIRRIRRGRGFSYVGVDGRPVTGHARRRIEAIAIPPAWTDVWICPSADGHILATGRDARGRKQYRYHPRWREVRDASKYERVGDFGVALPGLRERIEADVARSGLPEEKVVAAVVRLLDETLVRVGNQEYAATNGSYGLTTIGADHVRVDGSRIALDFPAKGGIDVAVVLKDRRVARIVSQCQELPGEDLFGYVTDDGAVVDVTSSHVNEYLRAVTGEAFTAKDFRTWGGTVVATETLAALGPADGDGGADTNVLAAVDAASERLGNTRAVCRSCYVHPRVDEAYRSGELLEAWTVSRRRGRHSRGERTVLKLVDAS